ncbi:hypothetical protein NUU61_005919, partial [Penicillium alfredii]
DWKLKGIDVASYTVADLVLVFSTKWSLRLANTIGLVKLVTLVFIRITGLVVLEDHISVKDPSANFRSAFAGTSSATTYGVTNALTKVVSSYMGYENAFNVVNEVKNPTKTLQWSAPLSLVTATLYVLANIAYFSCASKQEILDSKVVAAGLFFEKVFGTGGAASAVNFWICLSAFGNLLAVLIGQFRMLRECGRQGVLPLLHFGPRRKPFGTPLGPYVVKWAFTILMILAPPAGDAFNFIVDIAIYPVAFFGTLLGVGLVITRYRRARLGVPSPDYRAWPITIVFSIFS